MTVEISDRAHAAILMMVAAKTVRAARQAWRDARGSVDVGILRDAFRACTLAARSAHRAAQAYDHDPVVVARVTARAKMMDAAADDLLARLVRAEIGTDVSAHPTP